MYYETLMETPFGPMYLKMEEEYLTEAGFLAASSAASGGEITDIKRDSPLAAPLSVAVSWYEEYFAGLRPDPARVPLRLSGTAFQKEVWEIVRGIPYGQVLSYGEIARIIAARRGVPRMAAQAVGGAVGRNPVSILVPCHRVIGANGSMVGYGHMEGSIGLKRELLRLEGLLWA